MQLVDNALAGCLDRALERHRIVAGCQALHAFDHHGLRERRCSGRTVARYFAGFCRDFAEQLCAHGLEVILQFD